MAKAKKAPEMDDPCDPDMDGCQVYLIVPHDTEQLCLGPFQIWDGHTLQILKRYAKDEHDLEEHQYDLRLLLELGEEFYDYKNGL